MAEEQQKPTAEAIKQRRKHEKEAAKNAALGIEKFTIEVARVFKPDLKRAMTEHGIDSQQDIHQRLLRNLIDTDFETQVWMLRNVTTPYEPSEKVSGAFSEKSMTELKADPGDEIVSPELAHHPKLGPTTLLPILERQPRPHPEFSKGLLIGGTDFPQFSPEEHHRYPFHPHD